MKIRSEKDMGYRKWDMGQEMRIRMRIRSEKDIGYRIWDMGYGAGDED